MIIYKMWVMYGLIGSSVFGFFVIFLGVLFNGVMTVNLINVIEAVIRILLVVFAFCITSLVILYAPVIFNAVLSDFK